MPKRTKDFSPWREEKLADPANAANYLNAAIEESNEVFLAAVKDVIKAQESITTVAQKAGVTRESLHRSFSTSGNPTLDTLSSVLDVLGLKVSIAAAAPKARYQFVDTVTNAAANAVGAWRSGTVVLEGAYSSEIHEQQYYVGPGDVGVLIYRPLGGQYGNCGQTAIIR